MRIRFTRSARRHRIGKAHALYVMQTTVPTAFLNANGEAEYHWIGYDDRADELEIVGFVVGDILLIPHVMPTRYRRRPRRHA